ncbi:MAG: bifunctional 5,6,7,8-tetrahydromethanopterin hydro-lyase/3-hexulose-6-phosphate synthase [Candidatus Methanolliviera hydrocarbonicum]|uniref:Bifunctional enzyme Fae/Hps n=1 Tax=Candidatus Methanolliviera hydrocarbonicum TaxID=2491085 RepID=A0A520KV38_9EURY|nr:MAG: bifunctional 5,6,7,8-tetrahydromethanopterin hydro-lyase/3-hexulose-6-phosphate synthase [Candidatus Methanolliviera hydrocarbonicum]
MYLIGEALIGEGDELAHVDLMIGGKEGPVGMAFTNGMVNLSRGHTPLLSVIRPNLPTKPSTLIVPKVTIQDMEDANKIFGPAQTAVAKAVADSVEEGVIPRDIVEKIVVVVSVFVHPAAKDYEKIYRYNYGATKLAIQRAFESFPDVDTVLYEKDRSTHPIMGFRVTKLWDPPYLQVALDLTDIDKALSVVSQLPDSDHLILEAGTPLIKRYGIDVVNRLRENKPGIFIVADLKTLDTGNLEVRMTADASADAVVISGLAPVSTIEKSIKEAKKTGIYSVIDMLNVKDPLGVLKSLSMNPDVVEIHRAIDNESSEKERWDLIEKIKKEFSDILVGVAGGIRPENCQEALESGADILIAGRAITAAKDVEGAARKFLKMFKGEIDQFRIKTDF